MHPLDRLRETRLLPVLVGLGLVALGLLVMRLAPILPPFIWAAVTAYLLFPIVIRVQRRLRVPRVAAIFLVYILLTGLVVVIGVRVVPTLYEQLQSLATSLPNLIDTARSELVSAQRVRLGGFSIDTAQLNERIDEMARELAARFGREAVPLVLHTVGVLIHVLVYLLATFYFLLQGDRMVAGLRGLAPARHAEAIQRVISQVNQTFGAYIRAQFILFVIMSVATFIGLSALGIQYALALGIATGLLELIPIIGPWTAASIAMMVALSQGTTPFGWSPVQLAVVVGLMYLTLRMIEDQFIIPQLVGRIVRLHPLLVIFGVLAGAIIGGALGLLVAVPLLAAFKIIVLAVIEAMSHPRARRVVPLREPGDLEPFLAHLDDYTREHVVLLIGPGAVGWDELPRMQYLAGEAILRDIRVQVVTPDALIASIATAAGLEVITRVRLDEEGGVLADRFATPDTTSGAAPNGATGTEPALRPAAPEAPTD